MQLRSSQPCFVHKEMFAKQYNKVTKIVRDFGEVISNARDDKELLDITKKLFHKSGA